MGYFLIYLIIGVFDAFFMLYIPLYYSSILRVNRTELAFIQLLSYLALFSAPLLAFIYDNHIKKEKQAKLFLLLSLIPLCASFLIFVFFKHILALYGVFAFLSIVSKTLVRTGTTSKYLDFVEEAEDSHEYTDRKMKIIVSTNSASSVGFLLVSFVFNFFVFNITSLTSWNLFFALGWVFSIPIMILTFLFVKRIKFLKSAEGKNSENIRNKRNKLSVTQILIMGIIYIAIFLSYSESLTFFPRSEWIYDKFTENSFRVYSSLYFVFILIGMVGYYLSSVIEQKTSNMTSILFISICLYSPIMLLMTVSNFTMFMVLESILTIIASILSLTYISYVTDFSIKCKHKTFTYQLLATPSSIASLIFVPLGTYLSDNNRYENLVVISFFLFIISGVLLLIVLFLRRKGKNRILLPQERELTTM